MKLRNPSFWRALTISLFILLGIIGLAFKSGTGTISAFGYRAIDAICPLGAIEAMLASHSFLPRAVIALAVLIIIVALLGRFFCAWVCPMPLFRSWFPRLQGKHSIPESTQTHTSSQTTTAAIETAAPNADIRDQSANPPVIKQPVVPSASCINVAKIKPKSSNTPYFVLGGTLLSTAIFGFPVFCLICPIGLTFGSIIVLWRLIGYNEPTWSLLVFPLALIIELFVVRHWCKNICPLGALMSLLSKINHVWRPTVDKQACLRSKGLDCQLCTQVCYEDIDLHHAEKSAPQSRCTKCSECSAVCPVHAISFPFSRWLNIAPKAVIPTVPQDAAAASALVEVTDSAETVTCPPKPLTENDIVQQASRCIQCGQCVQACPLHNEIPAWMALLRNNHLIDVVEMMHCTNSLPEICGLVCPQERLCEGACSLGKIDAPVNVGAIEQLVTTTAMAQGWKPDLSRVKSINKRVAVIGAGPAGLACADVLIRHGIQPVVFDRFPMIGGMLSFGIPAYKLDKTMLQQRQQLFSEMGIEFHLNTEVGKDISFNELLKTHDAIFIGTGTYRSKMAGLANENAAGVLQALPYLMATNRQSMGLDTAETQPYSNIEAKHVVVIGGGDTAMDCIRTALRQKAASVTCLYRRNEASMPASTKEVILAKQEGAQFIFNVQPVELQVNGVDQITGVLVQPTKLADSDVKDRKAPVEIVGPRRVIAADLVIMALGFEAQHMAWLDGVGVERDNNGYIVTEQSAEHRLQTSRTNVYAGGDIVHGSDLVVTAIADGRRAAMSMITAMEQ